MTRIHAPLERFNINQQKRRDIFPPTLSGFCWVSAFSMASFQRAHTERRKSRVWGGGWYLVAVHCFVPQLLQGSERFGGMPQSLRFGQTRVNSLKTGRGVRATEICPNIFFITTLQQNQIKETTPLSNWITIFGSPSGSWVHTNEGLLFHEKLLSCSYIFDSSQCSQ